MTMTQKFACAKCSAIMPAVTKATTRKIACLSCGHKAAPVEVTVSHLDDGRRVIARMQGDNECQVCDTTEGVVNGLCARCSIGVAELETKLDTLAAHTTEEEIPMTFTHDELLQIINAAQQKVARTKAGTTNNTNYRMIQNLSGELLEVTTKIAEMERAGFELNQETKELRDRIQKAVAFYNAVRKLSPGLADRAAAMAGLTKPQASGTRITNSRLTTDATETKPVSSKCATHTNITLNNEGKCVKCEAMIARVQQAPATKPAASSRYEQIRKGIAMIAKGEADITKASDEGLDAAYNWIMQADCQDAYEAMALPVIRAELKRREAAKTAAAQSPISTSTPKKAANF